MQTKQIITVAIGVTAFVAIPFGFYMLSDAPFRSVLKDALSILTLLAFATMIGQFFMVRSNKKLLATFKPLTIQKFHKWVAYSAVTLILLHPYLIVVPRYFEAGVQPWTAFVEILSNFTNLGVLTGIIAWVALLVLGVTAYFRKSVLKRMAKKYRGWRAFHAVLVLLFILPASWHVIDLGRHVNWGLAAYFMGLLAIGLVFLARLYPETFPAKYFLFSKVKQS